jgi:eukaryotic-like serine/threonine-protein kinase
VAEKRARASVLNATSNTSSTDLLEQHFAQLLQLQPNERAATLAALAISEPLRAQIAALLAADALDDSAFERSVAKAALRLGEDQSTTPDKGARFGPWRVLREIGAGGMGMVFLAERADGSFEQHVAIKLLRGFPTEDGRRRLRQERQVLANLDHPYIAHLIDGGETEAGQPYLVMEFVEGETLDHFVARAELNCAQRVELLSRIAEAVAHAHQRLVIHRDLKPSNVLVRSDGTPKLLDFGVAKLLDVAQDSQRDTSTRVWSEGYASPEQIAGRAVTTATDVYALGALLRAMLYGIEPGSFSVSPDRREVPAVSPNRREVPAVSPDRRDSELRGVIAMACAERPEHRYASVDALREDLADYLAGRPLRAAADTAWYRTRKFLARHRLASALALVALVASLLFVLSLDRALRAAQQARDVAQLAQHEAEAQRVVAERVGEFMTQMFKRANSSNTGGKILTARDVIGTAGEQLLGENTLDPKSRALLLERLSSTLIELRDLEGASRLISAAQRERDHLMPSQAALIDHTQARVLARLDRLDEADFLNQRAQAALDTDQSNPTLSVRVMQQAMWLANRQGDFEQTLALAPRALAAWERDPKHQRAERSAIFNTQFIAEHALGRNAQMLDSLRNAWRDIQSAEGNAALARANAGANLGSTLIDLEQIDEADAVLNALEPFAREVFAVDQRGMLVRVLRIRARWHLAAQQPVRALQLLEEAEAIDRTLEPAQRDRLTLGLTRTAILLAQNQWAAAIAAADRANEGGLPAAKVGADSDFARAYALRAIARCRLGQREQAIKDAAAARLIVSDLPASQIERLVVGRYLGMMGAACEK